MKKITLLFLSLLAGINLNAQIELTQSTSEVVTGTNSIACPGGDNDWARNFVLANFGVDPTEDFTIESGSFGVQTNTGAASNVTVTIFATDAAFPAGFTGANVLGTQTVSVPAGATATIIDFVFTTPIIVPSGTTAVAYSISVPLGNNFFLGGTTGETTEGFIKSTTCAVTSYVTPSSINFPDANFFMTLTGNQNLSIGENSLTKSMSIFPNPTSGNLNIKFSKSFGVAKVDILTVNGQKIKSSTVDGFGLNTINTNDLVSGIYFVRISTSKENATVKFVKN